MKSFRKKDSNIISSKDFKARIIFILLFSSVLFYAGCQSKNEEAKPPEDKTNQVETIQTPADSASVDNQKAEGKEESKIPDLTGTWTGKLDSKVTTLKITSQDSTSFKGKITIHYRDAVNQEVKGTFNPEKMTINMSDQIRDRYMGKYNAKLSSDMQSLSGTFTVNINKEKKSFNLTKK